LGSIISQIVCLGRVNLGMNYIDKSVQGIRQCRVGYFSVLLADVILGKNVQIGNHVTVYPGTVIGDRVIIGDNCTLGAQPRLFDTSGEKASGVLRPLRIGADTIIGSGAVICAGVAIDEHVWIGDLTCIKEKCRIKKQVIIGPGVFIESGVNLGEGAQIQTRVYLSAHTDIADGVFIGPMASVLHDKVIVGRGAFVHGGAKIITGVEPGAVVMP